MEGTLEPGVAPTSPDDGASSQSKTLTRVSIYLHINTHSLHGFRPSQTPNVRVYAESYGLYIYALMHSYVKMYDLSARRGDLCVCLSIHTMLFGLIFLQHSRIHMFDLDLCKLLEFEEPDG